MNRLLICAGAAIAMLAASPALAMTSTASKGGDAEAQRDRVNHQGDYDYAASARAAETWGEEAAALAPQSPPDQALNPYGPRVIASPPVPDTPANRSRYGQPLSRSGRLTAPIGD